MTLALPNYTFLTIQDELLAEFGGSSSLRTEIKAKINHAIQLIWQEQKCWRWALKYITLTTFEKHTTTIAAPGAAQGATIIPVTAVGAMTFRWVFQHEGDPNEYLVTAAGAGLVTTLSPGILAAAATGDDFTAWQAWYELPADFAYMHTLRSESGSSSGKDPVHVEPWTLEKLRKGYLGLAPGAPTVYSIVPDPFPYTTTGWQSSRQYIGFYPYPETLTKWDGFYYSVPKSLVDDTDVSELPRSFSKRLFYKAAALVAAKLEAWERVKYYEGLEALGRDQMADTNSYADDSDTPLRGRAVSIETLLANSIIVP